MEKLRKELDLAKKNIPDESELKDIQLGESTNREFKSTFRFNLYTKKNDPEKITYACLKTIAGFLNTNGGSLYIGILILVRFLVLKKMGSLIMINFKLIFLI